MLTTDSTGVAPDGNFYVAWFNADRGEGACLGFSDGYASSGDISDPYLSVEVFVKKWRADNPNGIHDFGFGYVFDSKLGCAKFLTATKRFVSTMKDSNE